MNGKSLFLEPENIFGRAERCGLHCSKTLYRQVKIGPVRRLTPMPPMLGELNSSKRVRPS